MSLTVRSASLDAPSPPALPPRSLTTTLAPCLASSRAWPRPIPCPAPVTIATLPSSSPMTLPWCLATLSDDASDPRSCGFRASNHRPGQAPRRSDALEHGHDLVGHIDLGALQADRHDADRRQQREPRTEQCPLRPELLDHRVDRRP